MVDFAAFAATVDFGRASADKRGRNPKWPYVPTVIITIGTAKRTENPTRGLAFATRDEAVAHAQKVIDARRADLATRLGEPRFRSLREHHGFARELEDCR